MCRRMWFGMRIPGGMALALCMMTAVSVSRGQIPDHPIITEVFNNPTGTNDGPVGRDPTNLHQEYVEIYLPAILRSDLNLHRSALKVTFYEIEGDSGNSQRGEVNQRFDLTFDYDCIPLSNGTCAGKIARPSSGVVVLGWVDYSTTNPAVLPTGLAGTTNTRLGLINGGITASPSGSVFVAMNGAQFGGTTNFPVPVAESFIDVTLSGGLPSEQVDGVMRDGSNVYLLVNRDDPNYVSLDDLDHAFSDADLPGGSVLGLSSLLDGIAGNDDLKFSVTAQPYTFPTGRSIDLEDILRSGGVFSQWVAQIAEGSGGGYARRFVDQLRTTEDGIAGNENPATDAQESYRQIHRDGPFYPTPGRVTFTTSPPELGVGEPTRQTFSVLAGTTGRPGLISANLGGNYPINITATAGASSNPSVATFGSAAAATGVLGQSEAFPQIAVTVPISAANGATAGASVTFTASNSVGGDPSVVNPVQGSATTITVLKPTTGLDATVPPSPFQTTVFLAVQGFGADPAVANEFRPSSLGTFVNAQLGNKVQAALSHIATLLNPATNLEDNATMDPLKLVFPSLEADFINAPGTPEDLAATVRTSAKVVSGSTAYAGSLNAAQTKVKALSIPIPETSTKGGVFSASEFLFFANSTGDVFNERSGLSRVTTSRTFELAILDTNMTADPLSPIESGDDDDFGLIVQVGRVRAGASVVPGQLVFLSYMGGLEGEDIDTLDVPGVNATVAILLDLDNLDDVLGCQTITKLFVVDSGGAATVNVIEALSLNVFGAVGCQPADCNDGNPCTNDSCVSGVCQHSNNTNACNDGNACTTNDVCSGGACVGGLPLNCDTGLFCSAKVCDPLLGCVFDHSCVSSNGNPCPNPATCDENTNTCGGCNPPTAVGISCRYLAVTPADQGSTPIALKVIGECHDPQSACVVQYVQSKCNGGANNGQNCLTDADCPKTCAGGLNPGAVCTTNGDCVLGTCAGKCEAGTLGGTPFYKTASQWGTAKVRGAQIRPGTNYLVETQCDFPGVVLSAATRARTWKWGDIDGNGIINALDIAQLVDAFKARVGSVPFEQANIWGCAPDKFIDALDITEDVDAFKGLAFPCGMTCP
jgi:hypothetical protein